MKKDISSKPDTFMLSNAPLVDEALAALGPQFADRYIVTSAVAWDTVKDVPCLLFSILVDNVPTQETAWAQVFYLDAVSWVPAEDIAQLSREGVENHLIRKE